MNDKLTRWEAALAVVIVVAAYAAAYIAFASALGWWPW